jgi:hypothetical protein
MHSTYNIKIVGRAAVLAQAVLPALSLSGSALVQTWNIGSERTWAWGWTWLGVGRNILLPPSMVWITTGLGGGGVKAGLYLGTLYALYVRVADQFQRCMWVTYSKLSVAGC